MAAENKRKLDKGYSGRLLLDSIPFLIKKSGTEQELSVNASLQQQNLADFNGNVNYAKDSIFRRAADSVKRKARSLKSIITDGRSDPSRTPAKPRHWTPEEDESLRKAVTLYGEKKWKRIAEHVPGRNHTQCLQRWTKVLAPGLKKGQWSSEEDAQLLHLAQLVLEKSNKNKISWGKVARGIKGRTAKQCRERWVNNLDPSINKSPWLEEEDQRLLELFQAHPKKWSLIAKQLNGRTENAVKIRYKSLVKKKDSGTNGGLTARVKRKGRRKSVSLTKAASPVEAKQKERRSSVIGLENEFPLMKIATGNTKESELIQTLLSNESMLFSQQPQQAHPVARPQLNKDGSLRFNGILEEKGQSGRSFLSWANGYHNTVRSQNSLITAMREDSGVSVLLHELRQKSGLNNNVSEIFQHDAWNMTPISETTVPALSPSQLGSGGDFFMRGSPRFSEQMKLEKEGSLRSLLSLNNLNNDGDS